MLYIFDFHHIHFRFHLREIFDDTIIKIIRNILKYGSDTFYELRFVRREMMIINSWRMFYFWEKSTSKLRKSSHIDIKFALE